MSKTGIGAIITLLFTALNLFGIELPDGAVTQATEAIAQIVGIGLIIYSQFQRKDLTIGLIRK